MLQATISAKDDLNQHIWYNSRLFLFIFKSFHIIIKQAEKYPVIEQATVKKVHHVASVIDYNCNHSA